MKAAIIGILMAWTRPDFCTNEKEIRNFYESLVRLTIIAGASDSALRYKSQVLDEFRRKCGIDAIIY
jgi:hypothetical protein